MSRAFTRKQNKLVIKKVPVSERRRQAEEETKKLVSQYDPEKRAILEEMLNLTIVFRSGDTDKEEEREYNQRMEELYEALFKEVYAAVRKITKIMVS